MLKLTAVTAITATNVIASTNSNDLGTQGAIQPRLEQQVHFAVPLRSKRRLSMMMRAEQELAAPMIQRWIRHRWDTACNAQSALAERPRAEIENHRPSILAEQVIANFRESGILPFTPGQSIGNDSAKLFPIERLRKLVVVSQRTEDRRLLVTWTTGGEFAKMALNFALSVRHNVPALEASTAIVSLDEDAHSQLQKHGFTSVLLPGPQSEDAAQHPWQNDQLWKFKYRLMASLCSAGIAALVVDTDVVILSDPFPALVRDADIEVMTDLFFPEQQLLSTAMRPEDHVNTGYVFHTASQGALQLTMSFLDSFALPSWNGLKRDWFNQRAFNKFLLEWVDEGIVEFRYKNYSWRSLRTGHWSNAGGPTGSSRSNSESRRAAATVVVRVLDPAFVAHGMNYFWRRAHLLAQPANNNLNSSADSSHGLVVVHANGVEPKDYFMRDRHLWYIDDFEERYGVASRFLVYSHPRGLPLEEDFETLAAAVDLAIMLKRRVVLPTTMNCKNCPAYGPYGMSGWPLDDDGFLPGCTFDYFSRAGLVTGEWLQFTAESSVVELPGFQSLKPRTRIVTLRQLRKAIQKLQGRSVPELFKSSAILEIEISVRAVRDELKLAVGGAALDTLPCTFRPWPATTFACRDAFLEKSTALVGRPKVETRSKSTSTSNPPYFLSDHSPTVCNGRGQAECGVLPFMCCEVFFGWADKLQVMAPGSPAWDLPCGCGLTSHCKQTMDGRPGEVCCISKAPAAAQRFSAKCNAAPVPDGLPRLVPDDWNTYSSSFLRELAKKRISYQDAQDLCVMGMVLHAGILGSAARLPCKGQLDAYMGGLRQFIASMT